MKPAGRDRGRCARSTPRDRGSVTIEAVVALPILVAIVILAIQGLLAAAASNATTAAARDGARAAAAGRDGVGAASAQLPDWVEVRAVEVPAAVTGCVGVCSRVVVGMPIGLPGFAALGHVEVRRTADFPRS